MSDLLAGKAKLEDFKGIVFVGGFSYADVLDSAKVGQCQLKPCRWRLIIALFHH